MTSDMMGWLDQNRHRSYPFKRHEWRELVSPESGLDCVLLDALVFDVDSSGPEDLVVTGIKVMDAATEVSFRYGDSGFVIPLEGGDESGEGSYDSIRGSVSSGARKATISMSFSSHAYIKRAIGEGVWNLECPILDSRVVRISDGFGVDGIFTNGSSGVSDHASSGVADGDVVLEDGYRTSPMIYGGKVFVRVGKRYGHDPCKYDYGKAGARDCRKPLFFFCGQNAINSGNIILKGGRGINVTQGRSYTVRDDYPGIKTAGKTIPCIEITATQELMDIYVPSENRHGDAHGNM